MREAIAAIVYPVLKYGLQLKDRLARGVHLEVKSEQATLRSLLKSEHEASQWPEYGGDGRGFLGVRYALACWLDEIFCTFPSDWGDRWNNNKLETGLYNTNERSWSFWEEARKAEARAAADALEGFYLCVMLGFRGDMRDKPHELGQWREQVEAQFKAQEKWPGLRQWPELPKPPPDVPPLEAWKHFRRLLTTAVVVLGAAILILMFIVIRNLYPN